MHFCTDFCSRDIRLIRVYANFTITRLFPKDIQPIEYINSSKRKRKYNNEITETQYTTNDGR